MKEYENIDKEILDDYLDAYSKLYHHLIKKHSKIYKVDEYLYTRNGDYVGTYKDIEITLDPSGYNILINGGIQWHEYKEVYNKEELEELYKKRIESL
jgi:hypothetical protein